MSARRIARGRACKAATSLIIQADAVGDAEAVAVIADSVAQYGYPAEPALAPLIVSDLRGRVRYMRRHPVHSE